MKLVLLILTAILAVGYCQDDCPDPVECLANPCQNATCSRFLNAECETERCNGECKAEFYTPRSRGTRKLVTNCETEMCASKECPERRVCMDEVFPPNCPEDKPGCRQYMHAVCELPPKPSPPSDCSVVLCGPGTVCEVSETRNGPRAECVPFRPNNCEELGPCDAGMECRVREREGKRPVVRCVPLRGPVRPRDCSELECEEGFVCMLFGREGRRMRARCVKDRPPPQSCEQLDCEAIGMICREGSGRPRCRLPSNCEELTCPESSTCAVLNIPDIPMEFRCPFGSLCKLQVMSKLPDDRTLVCVSSSLSLQACADVECPDDSVCSGKYFTARSAAVSLCVPRSAGANVTQITTCDFVPDGFCSENEACIDFQQGNYRGFAHCTQINCDSSPCIEEEDTCIESRPIVEAQTGITHSCAPVERGMLQLETNCSAGRTSRCPGPLACTEVRMSTAPVGTICIPPFSLPPRNCEELSCEEDEECVLDAVNGQVVRASCVSSTFLDQLLAALEG